MKKYLVLILNCELETWVIYERFKTLKESKKYIKYIRKTLKTGAILYKAIGA